jgi:hypothetical protein
MSYGFGDTGEVAVVAAAVVCGSSGLVPLPLFARSINETMFPVGLAPGTREVSIGLAIVPMRVF